MFIKKLQHLLILLSILIFFAVFFAGCMKANPSNNNLDTWVFSANIRPSALQEVGKKATFFNQRIYYLSSELGQQGIYSMQLDGSDIQFEFPVEDIRALQVNNDGFYYCGFRSFEANSDGTYRNFRLFHRETEGGAAIDVIDQVKSTSDLSNENIWDFHFDSNGNLYLRTVVHFYIPGTPDVLLYSIVDGTVVPIADYQLLLTDEEIFEKDYPYETLSVYKIQDQYLILGRRFVNIADTEIFKNPVSVALFDEELAQQVLPIDNRF